MVRRDEWGVVVETYFLPLRTVLLCPGSESCREHGGQRGQGPEQLGSR